jgi:hypothetical protein
LEKLEFAAGQVSIMQEHLKSLQPQLKKTSDETEEIMIKIERETADAEKKKEVVGADESAANEAAATSQVCLLFLIIIVTIVSNYLFNRPSEMTANQIWLKLFQLWKLL